jgi:hypothetical protein
MHGHPNSQINQTQFAADYREVIGTLAPGALSIEVGPCTLTLESCVESA